MVREVVPAAGSHSVQLVVGQGASEHPARSPARAVEHIIVRVIHAVSAERRPQAAFIKRAVVRHEGQSGNARGDIRPHGGEGRCLLRIGLREAVHLRVPITVIVRVRADEAVHAVRHLPAPHHDHPHAAHAGAFAVGGLEVNGCKTAKLFILIPCVILGS